MQGGRGVQAEGGNGYEGVYVRRSSRAAVDLGR